MGNKEERDELLEALENFKNAWFQLSEAWEDYDGGANVGSYPFNESFDELGVEEWVDDFKDKISD